VKVKIFLIHSKYRLWLAWGFRWWTVWNRKSWSRRSQDWRCWNRLPIRW